MNRRVLMIAGLVLAGAATVAMAQPESLLYFTCREYAAATNSFRTNGAGGGSATDIGNRAFYGGATGNPTLPANNPVLYLQPRMPSSRHILGTSGIVADRDTSARPFQLWMSVGEKYIGANSEEVMSSIGFDITATSVNWQGPIGASQAPPPANRAGTITMSLTMYTLPADSNGITALWDGFNIITPPVTDVRAVTVPNSVGDFANGAPPTAAAGQAGLAGGSYRVASLGIQADGPGGGLACSGQRPTRYEIKLSNGNILSTRVVNPAFAGALTAEAIGYGYTGGGAAEVAVGGSCGAAPCGSVVGTSSATGDAFVEIRFKGDYRGALATQVPQGTLTNVDLNAFLTAVAAGASATPLEKFLGDFVGALATAPPNGILSNTDINAGLTAISTFGGQVPNCP